MPRLKHGLRVAQRRLKALYDGGVLRRFRETINDYYVYHLGRKTNKWQHWMHIMEVYLAARKQYVSRFQVEREVTLDVYGSDVTLRPDAIWQAGDKTIYIEVERQGRQRTLDKYLSAYHSGALDGVVLILSDVEVETGDLPALVFPLGDKDSAVNAALNFKHHDTQDNPYL